MVKGFGFITEQGVDKDHFVHISGLVDEIRECDEAEFDLEEGEKGLKYSKSKSCLSTYTSSKQKAHQ